MGSIKTPDALLRPVTAASEAGLPRALLVARNLPPLHGGIERLMQHALGELSVDWAFDVLGPNGCAEHVLAAGEVSEFRASPFAFMARAGLHLALKRPIARLVLASSGLMAPLARYAAARAGCPYVTWVHGLDIAYRHPVYRAVALPAIRGAARVIANSRHTAALAVAAGIKESRIRVVNPGVDVANPVQDADAAAFASGRGLTGRPLMLSVGRLVERKGLVEFVERSLPSILRARPAAQLLVVGAEPGLDAHASGPYRERIVAAARRAGVEGSVFLAGALPDHELQLAYAAADALVFPVLEREGDVEGFGMVAVEAAAQGTPTVGFAVGGVPDAVSAGSGRLVGAEDYGALSSAILSIVSEESKRERQQCCRVHAQAYSWDRYGAAVRKICRDAAGSTL